MLSVLCILIALRAVLDLFGRCVETSILLGEVEDCGDEGASLRALGAGLQGWPDGTVEAQFGCQLPGCLAARFPAPA